MPEVDVRTDIEEIFDKARETAAGEGELVPDMPERYVLIVTPGRMFMFQPCAPPGSMPEQEVISMRGMFSPEASRNVAVIAYNDPLQLIESLHTIPFLGMLLGLAYIGHAVWVFEGHSSALAAGCRDADVLIVDGGMVPYLQPDWVSVAAGVMPKPQIYVHDRATYSLNRVA
ncbi:MAG TPA: hypothetical protein VF721_05445 [Pyrinomonadaceae bacterium]